MNLKTKIQGSIAAISMMLAPLSVHAQTVNFPGGISNDRESQINASQVEAPSIELLAVYYPTEPGNNPVGYIKVDTGDRQLAELKINVYDNLYTLDEIETIDLRAQVGNTVQQQVIPFTIKGDSSAILRLTYRFEGDADAVVKPYWHNGEEFDYMSDQPCNIQSGWGTATINKPYGDNTAMIVGVGDQMRTYKKGFGLHADGWVETTGNLTAYSRFATDLGGQVITNPIRGNLGYNLQNGNTELARENSLPWQTRLEWDFIIDGRQKIRINCTNGADDNTNDVVTIGAPRLYYIPVTKSSQTISWRDEADIVTNKPVTVPLDAVAASGLKVVYRIVKGAEYASIENDALLNVTGMPAQAEIIVEAHQPGNSDWSAAPVQRCVFHLLRGIEVRKNEYVELEGGLSLEEIIVHADKSASGQVSVKSGLVDVKKLILKYTFVPGEWNYMSFPSDLDIDRIADFKDKGYRLNNKAGGGAYYIKSYDTGLRAQHPHDDAWTPLATSQVEGLKGYLVGIDDAWGTDSVEITFTIDNVKLDFESPRYPVNLSLDMTQVEPGTSRIVYVRPANVKGNTLRINVQFQPDDFSELPVNHEKALENMRYTFVGDRKAMRLTLPDQTPARVVFFDKSGKHVIKAVRYVSPMAIDLTGLPSGTYQVAVGYGPANKVFTVDI